MCDSAPTSVRADAGNMAPCEVPAGQVTRRDWVMLNEFKAFIAKGNVVDLAVGIIIGAAFTAIVNSLVADLINPIIGVITGGIDFSNLFINLGDGDYTSLAAAKEAGAPVFAYGSFITAIINFLIIAWVVFLIVKAVNRLKEATARKEEAAAAAAPAGPSELDVLLEIRDALKK
ncbi:UNVERIFIED_CONTAM: mscL [Trichonephila clavipes]